MDRKTAIVKLLKYSELTDKGQLEVLKKCKRDAEQITEHTPLQMAENIAFNIKEAKEGHYYRDPFGNHYQVILKKLA